VLSLTKFNAVKRLPMFALSTSVSYFDSHLDANFLSRRLLSGTDVDQLHLHGFDEKMLAGIISSWVSSID
jgi:hypothetical protein